MKFTAKAQSGQRYFSIFFFALFSLGFLFIFSSCNTPKPSRNTQTEIPAVPSIRPSSGKTFIPPRVWFKFRGDSRNTGLNPRVTGPVKPVFMWKFKARHEVMSSPSISSDGSVYIGSHDGNIYRINPGDGGEVFASTGEAVLSTPLVLYDLVLFGGFDGFFYCYDVKKSLKFKYKTGDWAASSAAVTAEGDYVFACRDGFLYCLDEGGSLKWKFDNGGDDYEIQSSPAVFGNKIITGSGGGFIHCLSSGGVEEWNFKTGGKVHASPAVDEDGNIYTGSWDKTFYCLDSRGKLKWKYQCRGEITSSAAITPQGRVVFGTREGRVISLEKDTGKEAWRYSAGGPVESSPASDGKGNIYVGADSGKVSALSPDGALLWEFSTPAGKPVLSSPALTEKGELVFGCEDKFVYCIGDGERNGERGER